MRLINGLILIFCLGLVVTGCGPQRFPEGTVDKFVGTVTFNGKPVSFPEDQEAQLALIHEGSAQRFGIPIKEDGTFDIGWMPIGKYTAILERQQGNKKKAMAKSMYTVPAGFTIEKGKTEYTIELGKGFKP